MTKHNKPYSLSTSSGAKRTPDLLPAFLALQTGPETGRQCLLDTPLLIIGRLEDNNIAINDTRVSRRHAQIRQEDFRYFIEDLGSTNGTWLNGVRLTAPTQLRHGDQIQIADILMVFHDPNTTTQAEAFRPLMLDEARGQVIVAGRPIKLTAKELALMRLLMDHAGTLCSKDTIAQAVWPEYHGDVTDYNIEGLVSRLRRKIEPDPNAPIYLHTQRGLGYILNLHSPPPTSHK
jgi:pSer/pThr/pTyr-binding forkhead associated (FHA) protein